MVLIAFRHGLRASELVDLRWDQVDLENALLHVRKLKNGSPATHPLTGKELRALRRLQREKHTKSPFVFTSERGTPFTKRGFQAMVERAGKAIGFNVKIHPHMLRHACGFKLANDGVDTRTIVPLFAVALSRGIVVRSSPMTLTLDEDEILSAAIAGVSKVAELIATVPAEERTRALEAAEKSYLETAHNLGYQDADAQQWASAVMSRLRIEEDSYKLRMLTSPPTSPS